MNFVVDAMDDYQDRINSLSKKAPKACVCSECLEFIDAVEGTFSECCEGIVVCIRDLLKATKGQVPLHSCSLSVKSIIKVNRAARKVVIPVERLYACWKRNFSIGQTKEYLHDYSLSTYTIAVKNLRFSIHKGNGTCTRETKGMKSRSC